MIVVLMLMMVFDVVMVVVFVDGVFDVWLVVCVLEFGMIKLCYYWQGKVEMVEEIQLLFKMSFV